MLGNYPIIAITQGFEPPFLVVATQVVPLLDLCPVGRRAANDVQDLAAELGNYLIITATNRLERPFLVVAAQVVPLLDLCPVSHRDASDVEDLATVLGADGSTKHPALGQAPQVVVVSTREAGDFL